MQKFKVNSQLVQKAEWKQTDGHTDGRTEATALHDLLMRWYIFSKDGRENLIHSFSHIRLLACMTHRIKQSMSHYTHQMMEDGDNI